ncbi:hypothetical protein VNO77_43449 [Canavalia gladiata]|uniref:Uncharacterized protein n=1 Tax=Canavalia gladiata TaxID=3824 RepID=A0AAN9JUT2_CANGL
MWRYTERAWMGSQLSQRYQFAIILGFYKGAAIQCISINKGAKALVNTHVGNAMQIRVISPTARVLHEGTTPGKVHVVATIARPSHSKQVGCAVTDCVNRLGTILALVSLLDSAINGSSSTSKAPEALAMPRSYKTSAHNKPVWMVLAEFPKIIKEHLINEEYKIMEHERLLGSSGDRQYLLI